MRHLRIRSECDNSVPGAGLAKEQGLALSQITERTVMEGSIPSREQQVHRPGGKSKDQGGNQSGTEAEE